MTTQLVEEQEQEQEVVTTIHQDLFSLYSLSFVSKSKDISERRVRLDFGLVAEVMHMKLACKEHIYYEFGKKPGEFWALNIHKESTDETLYLR